MELICLTCKKPFNVPTGEVASATIDYTFGKKTHIFTCTNCGKGNELTKDAFNAAKEAEKAPKPAAKPVAKPIARPVAKPVAKPVAAKPAAKPVAKPSPIIAERKELRPAPIVKRTAVVLTRSLHVRKDHSTKAETMAGLRKGDKVEVLSTWTDGKNTWVQIGADRWAAMEYGGDKLMEYE